MHPCHPLKQLGLDFFNLKITSSSLAFATISWDLINNNVTLYWFQTFLLLTLWDFDKLQATQLVTLAVTTQEAKALAPLCFKCSCQEFCHQIPSKVSSLSFCGGVSNTILCRIPSIPNSHQRTKPPILFKLQRRLSSLGKTQKRGIVSRMREVIGKTIQWT